MSGFVVDPSSLRAIAAALGRLVAGLDGPAGAAGLAGSEAGAGAGLGGEPLTRALGAFERDWAFGAAEVSGDVVELIGALHGAAGAYERVDGEVARDGSGTATTRIFGPPPASAARSGTGTTTIGTPVHDGSGTGTTRIGDRVAPPVNPGVAAAGAGLSAAPGAGGPAAPAEDAESRSPAGREAR